MSSKRFAVATVVLMALAVTPPPLLAQTNGQSPQAASDNDNIIVKGKKEKKICKTYDAPTGSRVGEKRVCRTESEWRQAETTAQRNMDRENQRFEALRAQLENEKNGLVRPSPH